MTLFLALTALSLTKTTPLQQSTEQGLYRRESLNQIESAIGNYLNGEEEMTILTPGEYSEWKQSLKAGQVIVAGAKSQAFDPALEIVDEQGTVLAKNDDRYPGDQRPLLFWRCERDGTYGLRARCFRDKSGGQVFVQFNTYSTLDVTSDQFVEGTLEATKPFLIRFPMKQGQILEPVAERVGEGGYLPFQFGQLINPNGLPERVPSFGAPLRPAFTALVAPLDGDYYVMGEPYGRANGTGKVRVAARDHAPVRLAGSSVAESPAVAGNTVAVWELPVKAGELLRVSVPDLDKNCGFVLVEKPDFSHFDVSKPESNPFFPIPRNAPPGPGAAVTMLSARDKDNRDMVFQVERDSTLWLATNGAGTKSKTFNLKIAPAATTLPDKGASKGHLRIADTDYWAFDAKAGEVLTLSSSSTDFSLLTILRAPGLSELRHAEADIDQSKDTWRLVAPRPGRYLLAVSCVGNGGGGDYTLSRSVLPPKQFGLSSPAKGEISSGEISVWTFTVRPGEPVLVKWTSTAWTFGIEVYDDQGRPSGFQQDVIDDHTRLGILSVKQPQTFVVVLNGNGATAAYEVSVMPLSNVIKGK